MSRQRVPKYLDFESCAQLVAVSESAAWAYALDLHDRYFDEPGTLIPALNTLVESGLMNTLGENDIDDLSFANLIASVGKFIGEHDDAEHLFVRMIDSIATYIAQNGKTALKAYSIAQATASRSAYHCANTALRIIHAKLKIESPSASDWAEYTELYEGRVKMARNQIVAPYLAAAYSNSPETCEVLRELGQAIDSSKIVNITIEGSFTGFLPLDYAMQGKAEKTFDMFLSQAIRLLSRGDDLVRPVAIRKIARVAVTRGWSYPIKKLVNEHGYQMEWDDLKKVIDRYTINDLLFDHYSPGGVGYPMSPADLSYIIKKQGQPAIAFLPLCNRLNGEKDGRDQPLVEAITHQYVEVVRALLDAGASVEVKDPRGWTAESHARRSKNQEIMGLVMAHKARRKLSKASAGVNPSAKPAPG